MPETAEKAYKAAEVCKSADVAPYVLKYWLTEFPCLSTSDKDKSANRTYSQKEVQIVSRIRQLLYDEGFTIAGAKKKIDAEITAGNFDGKPGTKKKAASAAPAPKPIPLPAVSDPGPVPAPAAVRAPEAAPPAPAAKTSPSVDPGKIAKELRDILKLLSR
jgi:DNA-binding transcriptional MerR regulator